MSFDAAQHEMGDTVPKGRKNDTGKLRWDLLPARPMFELVKLYTMGAEKYDDRNWENGLSWMRCFRALVSHSYKWLSGEKHDPADGQHHMASVAWYALALIEYEDTHPELDDRPSTFDYRKYEPNEEAYNKIIAKEHVDVTN